MENIFVEARKKIPVVQILNHVRKNHAMEHATINILESKMHKSGIGGYSISEGFWIIGNLEIQEIQEAVDIAQTRLKAGETKLAIHRNCGTNLAISAACSALASLAVLQGTKNSEERLERLPNLIAANCIALNLGHPLGLKVQEHVSTDANISKLQVTEILKRTLHDIPLFFVKTQLTE